MATPEQAAADLLTQCPIEIRSLPIVVEWIAEEHVGLDVQQADDLRHVAGAPIVPAGVRLSGLLLPRERRIWVDQAEAEASLGRRRFTIAHELGHWMLHTGAANHQASIYCRADNVETGSANDRLEDEANRFAAELLMPEKLVRSEVRAMGVDLFALAERFGVSSTAITLRLNQLGLLPSELRQAPIASPGLGQTKSGVYDSTRTRVAPIFDKLRGEDVTGQSWLSRLLGLPRRFDGITPRRPAHAGPLLVGKWWPREQQLKPPAALLRWLIEHPRPDPPKYLGGSASSQQRERLLNRDSATRELALSLLEHKQTGNAWHIFEGPTSVDVYLETADLIVLIEGKRTESGPTRSTTWMPCRDQMLRNLDDAWDDRGSRQIAAFLIVEGEPPSAASVTVPAHWKKAVDETVVSSMLEQSLPHRSGAERSAIANAFLGATTWQAVCAEFKIDFASLPDRVVS